MSDTKKVVINACYGGFGLSGEAKRQLIGCGHVKLIAPSEYYGVRDGWEKHFAEDMKRGDQAFGITVYEEKVVCDEHGREDRDCRRLVAVVEALGKAANGAYAELRVVEIPADVQYEIDEYDGLEHIAEVHRTWS